MPFTARPTYKSPADIEKMRAAGVVVSTVLEALRQAVRPGVSTLELDELAGKVIARHGGVSSFVGYRAADRVYRHHTCLSIGPEVVHGIPRRDRVLKEGEIVSLDVGVRLNGWHADSALTVPVGKIAPELTRLLEVTHESLWVGIRALRPRGRLRDFGRAVQSFVEKRGFTLVRELSGHGIGRRLWEAPEVFNYVDPRHPDVPLLEGLTIAVEPMVNLGTPMIETLNDGWTVVTLDRKASAHFEHTVAITRHGIEILTLGPHEAAPPPEY